MAEYQPPDLLFTKPSDSALADFLKPVQEQAREFVDRKIIPKPEYWHLVSSVHPTERRFVIPGVIDEMHKAATSLALLEMVVNDSRQYSGMSDQQLFNMLISGYGWFTVLSQTKAPPEYARIVEAYAWTNWLRDNFPQRRSSNRFDNHLDAPTHVTDYFKRIHEERIKNQRAKLLFGDIDDPEEIKALKATILDASQQGINLVADTYAQYNPAGRVIFRYNN